MNPTDIINSHVMGKKLKSTSMLQAENSLRVEIERHSDDVKSAFLEATKHPTLLDFDAPTSKFLAHKEYDVEKAATSIINYWRTRKDLFGHRAYLPFSLDGKGALTDEDVEILKTGSLSSSHAI